MPDPLPTPAEFQHWFALGLRAAALTLRERAYAADNHADFDAMDALHLAATAVEAEADALEPQEARDE